MVDDAQKREAVQWLKKGIAALKEQDVRQARDYLLKARALDNTNVDVLLWLTRTTRDPVKRKRILEQVLVLDPNHAQALHALERVNAQLAGMPAQEVEEEVGEPPAPEPVEAEAEIAPAPAVPPAAPEVIMAAEVAEEPVEAGEPAPPESLYLPGTEELVSQEEEEEEEAALPDLEDVTPAFDEGPTEEELSLYLGVEEAPARVEAAPPPLPSTQEMAPLAVGEEEFVPEARHLYPDAAWPAAQQARRCLTCGTISVPSSGLLAKEPCPLCMQKFLEPAQITIPMPDTYLPFQVSEAQAAIAIEDAESSGGLRLFRGRRQMSRPRAVFLPLWLFNATGRVEYAFADAEGRGGAHTEPYSLVPVHAVPQIDGMLLRLASNMELKDAPRYEARVGRKATVLLPNVGLRRALVEARSLMLNDARQKARRAIVEASRSAADLVIGHSEVSELAYQLLLLPVWVNDVREGNRVLMGFVNAYTGQALIGDPVQYLRRR